MSNYGDETYNIVSCNSTSTNKKGEETDKFTIIDLTSIFHQYEKLIYSFKLKDISYKEKVALQIEYTGDVMPSGKEEDRPIVFIKDIKEKYRKSDGKHFGYNAKMKSIGSGIENEFTIFNTVYKKNPVSTGDVILCTKWRPDGKYYIMDSYKILN